MITLTPRECVLLLEGAEASMQADLDAMEIYEIEHLKDYSQAEIRQQWLEIINKLKFGITHG